MLGTAVQLSERQFPALYGTAQEFAEALGLGRRPVVFLANGNGALNAFAAQAAGQDYVVVSSELFAHLREENRDGLRFILGHEMGHIRLHHVSLWYQLAVAYSQRIPILGPTLSRLREYSCDRLGAALEPHGAVGLVLLASGRYTETEVDIEQLLDQGRRLTRLLGRPRPAPAIAPVHGAQAGASCRARAPLDGPGRPPPRRRPDAAQAGLGTVSDRLTRLRTASFRSRRRRPWPAVTASGSSVRRRGRAPGRPARAG